MTTKISTYLNQCDPLQVIIAGTAGQGAVFSATLIAEAAAAAGYHVAQTARSSAAVRSGPSTAHVSISSEPIDFPFIEKADVLIALAQETLRKNIDVRNRGVVLFEMPENNRFDFTHATKVPIPKMPKQSIETMDMTNMVMVGALTHFVKHLSKHHMRELIQAFPPNAVDRDLDAFEYGLGAAAAIAARERAH